MSKKIPFALVVLIFMLISTFGVLSTGFGHHWDERQIIKSVINTKKTGLLLPRRYFKPSIPYNITLVLAVTKSIKQIRKLSFNIFVRKFFFLFSICSGLALYFLAKDLSNSAWAGLFASLSLITSFEFFYHARWMAPDALLVLFIICSMLFQYKFISKGNKMYWLVLASISAGLCISTKYPGGIILVPLFILLLQDKNRIKYLSISILIISLGFVLTSPGAVLEPQLTIEQVIWIGKKYKFGQHWGYRTDSQIDHISKLLTYLFLIAPSKNMILSYAISPLAMVGVITLITKRFKVAIWFLSLPIIYFIFMTSHSVMIARNYLLLFPFVFILAAIGIHALSNLKTLKIPLVIFAVFIITYNINVEVVSAIGIIKNDEMPIEKALQEYILSHKGKRLYLSKECLKLLKTKHDSIVSNLSDADYFVFRDREVNRGLFVANTPNRYNIVWRPYNEVNLDYYPSFYGDKILSVSTKDEKLNEQIKYITNKN